MAISATIVAFIIIVSKMALIIFLLICGFRLIKLKTEKYIKPKDKNLHNSAKVEFAS